MVRYAHLIAIYSGLSLVPLSLNLHQLHLQLPVDVNIIKEGEREGEEGGDLFSSARVCRAHCDGGRSFSFSSRHFLSAEH